VVVVVGVDEDELQAESSAAAESPRAASGSIRRLLCVAVAIGVTFGVVTGFLPPSSGVTFGRRGSCSGCPCLRQRRTTYVETVPIPVEREVNVG
jgi:hypothetical protein